MQVIIVAVGQRMPSWVDQGFEEYAKRLPAELGFELREVKPEARGASRTALAAMQIEADRIRAVLPRRAQLIVLDERGRDLTSSTLAEWLQSWREEAAPVCLVIGGADGLDATLKQEARASLRLSSMTLPHGLVRVMLAEQIYRAWSILQNHPYHRS
jgi:23S rRNA (pseudouridine1915-N3)-methyltransferase